MDRLFYMRAFEVIVLSGISWAAPIRFMFSLFRIKTGGPWIHAVLLSGIMMILTWGDYLLGGEAFAAVLQFATIFLYLTFILRLKWFHALLIDAVGCLITLFVMVVTSLIVTPPENILKVSTGEQPVQHLLGSLLTFMVLTAASHICDHYRLGFTFVGAHSKLAPVRVSYKLPLALFAVTVASVLVFPAFVGEFLPFLLAIAAVSLFFLLRWSLKYEMTE